MNQPRHLFRFSIVAIALSLPGACRGGAGSDDLAAAADSERANVEAAVPVEVVVAERGSLIRSSTVSGLVEPIRSVGVNAQMAGALLTVRVEEGNRVRSGQVLAELDAREITAQVRSAQANLTLARSVGERAEQLWNQQIITAAEYERDRAALAAAEAQVEQLRTRLEYATVRSPIEGVITQKRVETGDVVGSLTRLFTVADLSTLVVRVHVSELDVAHLRTGDVVAVAVDALPQATLQSRIRQIFPAADSVSRLVPVEVALSGPDAGRVMPGFMARVTLRIGDEHEGVLVPASAVLSSGGSPAVFVVRGASAARAAVRPGQTAEGRVEIVRGLAAGDSVIVAGNVGLRDGAPVRVVPRAAR
ncbi:MAG: efflux RND transporter periplasmic adaptor subunit [Gemmatimonadetes bacterium]|nr:efflux RND transporter periplasmic adaptor subunit [Gemmatimonadota bacterium]